LRQETLDPVCLFDQTLRSLFRPLESGLISPDPFDDGRAFIGIGI
jgi:hypothetical protein